MAIEIHTPIEYFLSQLQYFLEEKNKRYGNSVTEPLTIFSKHTNKDNTQAFNNILIRLDDKLKRIKNSDELRDNDVVDMLGYLVFLAMQMDIDLSQMLD